MSAGEERALVFIENKTISTMKAILFAIVLALLPLGVYGQGSEEPMSYIYACGVKAYDNWDYASAYQYFMRELEDSPNNGFVYCYLTNILHYFREDELAMDCADKALKYLPREAKTWRADAYNVKATLLNDMGEYAKALPNIDSAVSLNPDEVVYLSNAAGIYSHFSLDTAEIICRRAIALDPTITPGYIALSDVNISRKRFDEALKNLNHAISLSPDEPYIYFQRAKCYAKRAESCAQRQDYGNAAGDLITAVSLGTQDRNVMRTLIDLHVDNPDIVEGKVKEKIAQTPESDYWCVILSGFYRLNSRFRDAISVLKVAYERGHDKRCLYAMAENYASIGKFDMAFAYLDSIKSIDPKDGNILFMKAYFLMAQGNMVEAADVISSLIGQEPDNEHYYYCRGVVRERSGDLRGAIEDYSFAIASYNNSLQGEQEQHSREFAALVPNCLLWRGLAYRKLGNEDMALADLRSVASRSDPFSKNYALIALGRGGEADTDLVVSIGHFLNAVLKWAVGDNEAALRYLRMGLEKQGGDFFTFLAEPHYAPLCEIEGYEELIEEVVGRRNPEPKEDSMVRFVH